MGASLRRRMERLRSQLEESRIHFEGALDERRAAFARSYASLKTVIDARAESLHLTGSELSADWRALRARLQPVYLALAEALRAEDIHVPSVRPTNVRRTVFHISSGFAALTVIQLAPAQWMLIALAVAFAGYAWSMEYLRRKSSAFNDRLMSFYGPLAHPHEWKRINSATWYASALVLLALSGSTLVCSLAVVVLALGDPAASIVGRRWGKVRLVHARSLEGTATFALTGAAVSFAVISLFYPALGLGTGLLLSCAAGLSGAVTELFSRRLDDNFTIPVGVGAATFVLSAVLGL